MQKTRQGRQLAALKTEQCPEACNASRGGEELVSQPAPAVGGETLGAPASTWHAGSLQPGVSMAPAPVLPSAATSGLRAQREGRAVAGKPGARSASDAIPSDAGWRTGGGGTSPPGTIT